MENKLIIGNAIKEKRKNLGITQEEFAKKLGYKTRVTVNRIENGIVTISNEKLEQIAKVLNCDIDELLINTLDEPKQAEPQQQKELQIANRLEYEEVKDNELNEILLKIYMKYLNEYKELANEIDMLKIKYLSLRNAVRVKNAVYNEIYGYFRNISNDIILNGDKHKNIILEDFENALKNTEHQNMEKLLIEIDKIPEGEPQEE